MANESQNESPQEQWPEEVRLAYEHLKVPSLYDCVLANEKLSLEVRKQNRDVKSAVDGMQKIATVLDSLMEIISEEWEEVDEEEEGGLLPSHKYSEEGGIIEVPDHLVPEEYDNLSELEVQLIADKQLFQDQVHSTLLETMDSIIELTNFAQKMTHQLFKVLPDKEGLLRQSPSWHAKVEEIVESFVTHISRHKNRFQARLEEMQIFVIEPKSGDPFDKNLHLKLEEITGGETNTIAQVIRLGYRYDTLIIRQAEVIVFT